MDPRSTEPTQPEAPEPASPTGEEPEAEPASFTPEYVRGLRREAAERRRAAKEAEERLTAQEAEMAELREARLHRAITDANTTPMGIRRLADPTDLLIFADRAELVDDAGRPDPARIEQAIDGLIERKPHLRYGHGTVGGAWGGWEGGSNPAPTPSLGELIGRAARGEREG